MDVVININRKKKYMLTKKFFTLGDLTDDNFFTAKSYLKDISYSTRKLKPTY
jgi:hypothetical protein